MISGLTYIPDFITPFQEKWLVDKIDQHEWSTEIKRRVQHYGYKYDYTKKKINGDMKAEPLQFWMKEFSKKMLADYFSYSPDQVIINEYLSGQGISSHIDCTPCFSGTIASLSLLSECTMKFIQTVWVDKPEVKELVLELRSLLVLEGEARYDWTHGILGKDNIKSRRISVTFRNVIIS